MKRFWQTLQEHRMGTLLFLAGWIILWIITIATWMYSEAGYSFGMPMGIFALHFAPYLAIGFLAVWWLPSASAAGQAGLVGVGLYTIADIAAVVLWGAVLATQGRIDPSAPDFGGAWGNFLEVVEMALLFFLVGSALAGLGGLAAALLKKIRRAGG